MAETPSKKKTQGGAGNDFDVETIAKTSDKHEADLVALGERVKIVETTLTPQGFISFLEKEQDKNKDFDKLFAKVFLYLLQKDDNIKAEILSYMQKCDRSTVWKVTKIFGGFVGWIISLAIAAYVGHFF